MFSSSSSTDVEEEMNHLKRRHHSGTKTRAFKNRSHFSPTTQRILNNGQLAHTTTLNHNAPQAARHRNASRTDPEVVGSLNAINTQLGELLSRLENPPPTTSIPAHSNPSWLVDESRVAATSGGKANRY